MIVSDRIGQSVVAALAAIMLAATAVGVVMSPVAAEANPAVTAPAALVVALLSSQAGA